MTKKLRTAPQILEHYVFFQYDDFDRRMMLTAMRAYAKVKSDIAYEKGYRTAINQMK